MDVRIKHINKVTAKGRTYYYCRITGQRISADPETPEFAAEVSRVRKGLKKDARPEGKTLGALIRSYKNSTDFKEKRERTRADYYRIFDYLQPLDDMPLRQISPPFIRRLQSKRSDKNGVRAANYTVQILSVLFNYGIAQGIVRYNPAARIKKLKSKSGDNANRPWDIGEREAVMDAAPDYMKVPIALGMYAGFRIGDAITVRKSQYKDGRLEINQRKTGGAIDMRAP